MTRPEQMMSALEQAQFRHLDSLIRVFVGGIELHAAKVEDTDDLDIYGIYLEPAGACSWLGEKRLLRVEHGRE